MKITNAQVRKFKSIEDSGDVPIDSAVTVLVGQNESGKTAFLQALHKARPVDSGIYYDLESDYPRKDLISYKRRHKEKPERIARLTYKLEQQDIDAINEFAGFQLVDELTFSVDHKYDGTTCISISLDESKYIREIVDDRPMSLEIRDRCAETTSLRQLKILLDESDLNAQEAEFLEWLNSTFNFDVKWDSVFEYHVWTNFLKPHVPKFVYFDDYYLLPGKISLTQLAEQVASDEPLEEGDKVALSLLRLAEVDLDELLNPAGYESVKSQLEAISNSITDKVFEYWKQNSELDVEFDVRTDENDKSPFDEGPNLYIRIRNRRHRVGVPFSQRSKGFIWFFSFIAWFDSIQQEVGNEHLVLLLDEPGLSLHALAQADFLNYIDDLSRDHQINYTTHSPFMVQSDRLKQVRTVEDKDNIGTKISAEVLESNPDTIFPLQAALGYNIAQNLFISRRNLLVEGVADLLYLQYFSEVLRSQGKSGLRDDLVIAPVGGLDKLATFIALIGANQLELTVLSDYAGRPDQRIGALVRERLIQKQHVLNYAQFRGTQMVASDVEDLISPGIYLSLFNDTFKSELNGTKVKVSDLPPGDRIVDRLNRYLESINVQLKRNGGFNHYRVASHLVNHPLAPSKLDATTLGNFEKMFSTINCSFNRDLIGGTKTNQREVLFVIH